MPQGFAQNHVHRDAPPIGRLNILPRGYASQYCGRTLK